MKIAIIGCGNMGGALAKRLAATSSQQHEVLLYDTHIEKTQALAQDGYGMACGSIVEAVESAEMIILAVKPGNLAAVAACIQHTAHSRHLVVSVLAGTSIQTLKQLLPHATIVRMMPNLPVVLGQGVIGVAACEAVQSSMKDALTEVFTVLGKVYWLPEDKIDALTALAGSGPAFFYVMVEAMVDAGIAMGFPAQKALDIVYNMLYGSLLLLQQSQQHPAVLKWQIASPQGTTIAGLRKMEELALRGAIMNTFLAAFKRE